MSVLTNLSKPDLLDLAEARGITDVSDDNTKQEIADAIEAAVSQPADVGPAAVGEWSLVADFPALPGVSEQVLLDLQVDDMEESFETRIRLSPSTMETAAASARRHFERNSRRLGAPNHKVRGLADTIEGAVEDAFDKYYPKPDTDEDADE